MSINTTIYMHNTTHALIEDASTISGNSFNRMICLLLRESMTDSGMGLRTGATIRYQHRDREKNWRTIHVRFREDEADYFKDMRNFYKRSLSLILAIAVRLYLKKLLAASEKMKSEDNYTTSNYILVREEDNGLIFWKICWGYPENPEKHFRLPTTPITDLR